MGFTGHDWPLWGKGLAEVHDTIERERASGKVLGTIAVIIACNDLLKWHAYTYPQCSDMQMCMLPCPSTQTRMPNGGCSPIPAHLTTIRGRQSTRPPMLTAPRPMMPIRCGSLTTARVTSLRGGLTIQQPMPTAAPTVMPISGGSLSPTPSHSRSGY